MWNKKNVTQERNILNMEILNLILFGCVFYLAFIGVPSLCEKNKV